MFAKLIYISALLLLTIGFRTYGPYRWDISSSSPNLYINVCSSVRSHTFTDYSGLSTTDPLYATTPSSTQAINSIIDDYNNISNSYLNLSTTSSDISNKTIYICFGNLGAPLAGGEASFSNSGSQITTCTITLSQESVSKLSSFMAIVTHEIGHCFGLDHPQDTQNAIMSYFVDSDTNQRLMLDDKMGITYLYPNDQEGSLKETPNYGLSCDTK
jgi:hypothetical protein